MIEFVVNYIGFQNYASTIKTSVVLFHYLVYFAKLLLYRQAHTVSVLIIVVIALTYYVFTEKEVDDQEYNSKR